MHSMLEAKGWHLSDNGIQKCKELAGNKNDVHDIIQSALNLDLRHIAKKFLPENINSGQVESIPGPVVLQVQKVRNITAPLINQESKSAPRMIKLNLTDGFTHCAAIEYIPLATLNLSKIIPGTKICLTNKDIMLTNGLIMLYNNEDVKFLGGEVEKLKAKWEASQDIKKRNGQNALEGPPAFKDFDSVKHEKSRNNQDDRSNNKEKYNNRHFQNRDSAKRDQKSSHQSYRGRSRR